MDRGFEWFDSLGGAMDHGGSVEIKSRRGKVRIYAYARASKDWISRSSSIGVLGKRKYEGANE